MIAALMKPAVTLALASALILSMTACQPDYADDLNHPIPSVTKIDWVISSDQALRYGLVIASPLGRDSRSLSRLTRKCQNYLADFRSPQTRAQLAKRPP